MIHFFSHFGMGENMATFELCVSPLLTQSQHVWNFHGLLTLDNAKLI